MKHLIASIASVMIALAAAGCGATPGPGPTPGFTATPDFTGVWIGVSQVVSCESPGGGCASYHLADTRYLDFRLTQLGDDVTGNLSPTRGGPLALPAVFWISGHLASGRLAFGPMEVAGFSGSLTSFSGEVMLKDSSPAEMLGRMTERTTRDGQPMTIVWDVRTVRQ